MATATDSDGDDGPDLDRLLTVLADRRRRWAIAHCRDRDRIRVGTLAALIAGHRPPAGSDPEAEELAREESGSGEPTADVSTVQTDLHHRHLPQLVDAGLLTYRGDRATVAITDRGDRVGAWLERAVGSLPQANRGR